MSKQTITCNLNCICINSDCIYNHFIEYKNRKIVKKFYDSITNKNVEEPNNETRKKNCTFGQLCENKKCGFRHRLSYANRENLIVLYKFNKICPSSQQSTKSINTSPAKSKNDNKNSFMILDSDEYPENDNVIIKPSYSGKSWVDVVKTDDISFSKKDEKEFVDDGFYMDF